jgi:leader peptidase (prepilin peptidase)/N-methyltransferase
MGSYGDFWGVFNTIFIGSAAFFGLLGLMIGSFLNVLIIRIPKGESVVFPSSHCCSCGAKLRWYHNIPLFSWLFLRGRCAFCGERISVQYPLVELISALIFITCFFVADNIYWALANALCFALLLALSLIDIKLTAVPDTLSIPAFLLALLGADILGRIEYALLFAGGFALLRFIVSALMKREAMGEADIIIAAIIGAMLGVQLGLVAIYISALIALPVFFIIRRRGYEMPFIPYLALGVFVTYIFQDELSTLVRSIYG